MKDKLLKYIEKLQPLVEKIKLWLKTKKAWVQIGLSLVAIICLILAGVSSCSRRYVNGPTPKATATVEATEKATDTPEPTATPEATELPATSTPSATENVSSSSETSTDDNSDANSSDPVVQENSSTESTYTGPTGAPLYTSVPEENVSTLAKAYQTTIASCWGDKDYSSYSLFDMDGDGVEELIMHYGADDMQAYIDIYTYTEEGLIFVGDVTGSFANVSGCADGGIFIYYRREINGQKYESIDRIEKIGSDIMVHSRVISEKVDQYTVEEADVEIPHYRLDDFSPLS